MLFNILRKLTSFVAWLFIGPALCYLYIEYVYRTNPDPICTYAWRVDNVLFNTDYTKSMCKARGNIILGETLFAYKILVDHAGSYVALVAKWFVTFCIQAVASGSIRFEDFMRRSAAQHAIKQAGAL